ncbi:MAG TPA: S1 RNA-binding domain-containing protein [Bellilinea sp.]|nr:S1 RNA-binding domain-containing protein [Bellilinea sp.]
MNDQNYDADDQINKLDSNGDRVQYKGLMDATSLEIAGQKYRDDEVLRMKVVGGNRGGLLVEGEGVSGFVPVSHLLEVSPNDTEIERKEKLARYYHRMLDLKIIEYVKEEARVVLSERAALSADGMRNYLIDQLKPGTLVRGVVTNLTSFGAFVDLGGIEGLIHLSELSWGRVRHPSEVLKLYQEIEVSILNIDERTNRIALSLKRLQPNPWDNLESKYKVGDVVRARLKFNSSIGWFAEIEDGLEGLIHQSVINKFRKETDGDFKLFPGKDILVRILQIEPSRRRLSLGLDDV